MPTYHVFAEANRELFIRRGLPDTFGPEPPVRMMAFRGYAREHHGDGYWVAYDGDRMVGFGIGVRHPGVWYLAALQILPEYQGRGIGQRLLELSLGNAEESDTLCAISAGFQPVSNAIYVRAGMLPWVPIFDWETSEGAEVPRARRRRVGRLTGRRGTRPTSPRSTAAWWESTGEASSSSGWSGRTWSASCCRVGESRWATRSWGRAAR